MSLTLSLDRDQDGSWTVECPAIPGYIRKGRTRVEALANIEEAIARCLDGREEAGPNPGSVEEAFARLAREWKATRPPSSSAEKLAMHPAYQRIIGLGPVAIPPILRELEEAPDH